MPPSNQCPFCQRAFPSPSALRSHQQQTGHWAAPPPDSSSSDKNAANVAAEAGSPGPDLSRSDASMRTPSFDSNSLSDKLRVHASTPLPSNHSEDLGMSSPHVSDGPEGMRSPLNDPAPYGVATNKEELRVSIQRILEDMIKQNTDGKPEQSQSSSSARGNSDAESGSELGSEEFYTAANNSTDDLTGAIPPGSETESLANIPDDLANASWGTPLRRCKPMLEKIFRDRVANGRSPDWPFADYLEFEFVKWMVVNDISQTARDKLIKLPIMERCGLSFASNYSLNKLLDKLPSAGPRWTRIQRTITGTLKDANGKNLKEEIEIWVRDIVEVVRELIGNTTYGKKLVFVPQRVTINGDPSRRKIDEMWTADWWMRIQQKLPPGSTVVPIILSSDSTQLTNFSGGKSAWPVYITLGNIPKSIRAQVNSYSSLLLAYLPVPKLHCFPSKTRGDQKARIFHESMAQILEPLISAGKDGIEMDCGDGYVRRCYPILAAYIADNPEQTLIAGCQRNLCHRCTVPQDERGDLPETPYPPRIPDHTAVALEAHDYGHTSTLFDKQGLKPFGKPFWADLPHANIFSSLTPDILHQLHKGVFKEHLMEWCLTLIRRSQGSATNVDYRYMAMPQHSNLRHFSSGVTKLKQTTANEHREIQKVFTAVMAGLVPEPVLPVILAVIDFIHFARLPAHTTETLALLEDALDRFHEHKHVFVEY
ncbi:hypothetical protein FRC07_008704, partial [Ceratobasidium sp. 392]